MDKEEAGATSLAAAGKFEKVSAMVPRLGVSNQLRRTVIDSLRSPQRDFPFTGRSPNHATIRIPCKPRAFTRSASILFAYCMSSGNDAISSFATRNKSSHEHAMALKEGASPKLLRISLASLSRTDRHRSRGTSKPPMASRRTVVPPSDSSIWSLYEIHSPAHWDEYCNPPSLASPMSNKDRESSLERNRRITSGSLNSPRFRSLLISQRGQYIISSRKNSPAGR